jgi:GNAT superfamily N-acetyltransferase
MIVRAAEESDVPAILRCIVALATYEREPNAVRATESSLMGTLFAAEAQVHALVAERDGDIVGIAIWFLNYSTWTGRPGIYLEDLFVTDAARGLGVGRALFRALAQEAQARDCARIDWAVLDWNKPAMDFYRTLGAGPQSGWQPWRLEGAALEALAR